MSAKLVHLQRSLEDLLSENPEAPVRLELQGAGLDFGDFSSLLQNVLDLFREIGDVDLTGLPASQIDQLQLATDQTARVLYKIKSFDPAGANPAQQRNLLGAEVVAAYDQAFTTLAPLIAYASVRNAEHRKGRAQLEKLLEELNSLKGRWESDLGEARAGAASALDRSLEALKGQLQETQERLGNDLQALRQKETSRAGDVREEVEEQLQSSLKSSKEKMTAFEEEAASILRSTRVEASATALAEHANLFSKEADGHAEAKKKWFRAAKQIAWTAGGLGLANIVLVVCLLSQEYEWSISLGLAKILFFSVVYYALVWVVRLYRAASHNEVVNKHRALALQTYKAFAKATTDEQVKEAMLLRASECIFGHQVSGFSDPGREDAGPTKLVEIVRGVQPKADRRD